MIQPIASQKIAFNATNNEIFYFTSNGGDQVVKNRLTVRKQSDNSVVYQTTVETFLFQHTLPSGTLTNVYKPIPSVCIGSSSVLPTADEQTAYNCIKYSTVDADTLTLKLYAESVPTSAFYVKVIGAA